MRKRHLRFFTLLFLILLGVTGYLKGCESEALPKQKTISSSGKDSIENDCSGFQDTMVIVPAGAHYKRGKLHTFIFGKHYRTLWSAPVKMEVFDIEKVKGGLRIIQKGGSMQTLNLRLEDREGNEYVLRTIDKDNSKALPHFWRNKVLNFMIRDQTSALNPYAALIIPPLAESAGIYHTNPELFFIPYDKRFGKYKEEFEGRVAILEEQPEKSWKKNKVFGSPENIVSTITMLEEITSKQNAIADQKEYAKARIFDLWINDWDRHSDQWKWAEFREGNKKVYKPIPRDRDMAFFKFNSGIIPQIVTFFNPKFQSFTQDYKKIKGLSKNAVVIDNFILTGISKKDFLGIARELQARLSDSVIYFAVSQLPSEIFKIEGEEIINILKSRRNNLVNAAEEYYNIVFELVKITGTDQNETFIIERMNDHETSVTIIGKNENILFHHIYNHSETKGVYLYGLKGEDKFIVKGKVNHGIVIRIYGGEGRDKMTDESIVKGYKKKTKIYDTEKENDIEFGPEKKGLTSSDPGILYFDRSGKR
jgi:hypothetical protein